MLQSWSILFPFLIVSIRHIFPFQFFIFKITRKHTFCQNLTIILCVFGVEHKSWESKRFFLSIYVRTDIDVFLGRLYLIFILKSATIIQYTIKGRFMSR